MIIIFCSLVKVNIKNVVLILRFFQFLAAGKGDIQNRLDNAMQDVTDKYMLLEEAEKNAVRTALIEERSRFCHFVSCLKPVVVSVLCCINLI